MKKIICFIFFLTIADIVIAQDSTLVQKTYVRVIKTGFSTAPDLIVVTIRNLNTGESKELCTTASFFLGGLEEEQIPELKKSYENYLLSKSVDRTFGFKSPKALKNVDFLGYHLKHESEINFIIKHNHLRDSLKKLNELRDITYKEQNKYYYKRKALLINFTDSLRKTRALTSEENQIIIDLTESVSYEETYNNPKVYNYKKLSQNGLQLMALWLNKIPAYKQRYIYLNKEVGRMYRKFFQKYYDKYGLSFCHVAFNNGIITYQGDEVATIGFGDVID